ncbi:cardiolipin synthase [Mycoplasmatota bacterium]|nr:cardiolipin synthase [Mycoplasmatota bacterium]
MDHLLYILIAIYLLNFFFGLKILFKQNINLSNMTYTFLLIIIFPFFTPFIYLLIVSDEQIRRQLIKKREIDEKHIQTVKSITVTQHNEVRLFNNGDLLFEDMFEEIERAEHYIHISFYTFNTDQIGKSIIKKLEEKLKQNVDVKILYDSLGSFQMKKKYFNNFIKLGGEIIPFIKLKRKFLNINYRNHRKIMIIDNKIAYIGGFNIGDKYLGRDKKLGLWVDSQLKIIGNATTPIEKRFLADYMYCSKKEIDIKPYLMTHQFKGNKLIEILSSGPDISEINYIENKFIQHIYQSQKCIYIQTPYLILNDAFIKALKYASLRNVEIKIMIPNKNDHPFVLQATKAYASLLVDENIKVYLFNKKSFLHSKVFICDDHYVSIGTTNFDIHSFKYNLEINAFVNDSDLALYTKTIFNKQLTYCTEYTKMMIQKESSLKKVIGSFCKLLSTIL